jgi:hypothetical protein
VNPDRLARWEREVVAAVFRVFPGTVELDNDGRPVVSQQKLWSDERWFDEELA